MKIVLLSLFVFTLYTGGSAQSLTPEQTAKDFYKWYLTELNAEREPIRDNKRLMLQKVSARLGKWLYSKAYEEYGADYILDAQDYEQSWANGISAAPAVTKGNASTVRLTLTPKKGTYSGFGVRKMNIKLVKENGVWMIDMVNNRKLIS
jgi:hypothetical protein